MNNTQNPGKGLGTTGFILSLLGLVVGFVIYMVCDASAVFGGGMGLAIGWSVFCAIGLVLSFMGMSKSKATGHKPGLAMGGLICGIIAVVFSLWTIYTVHVVHSTMGTAMTDLTSGLDSLSKSMQHSLDSMTKDTATHK